MRAILRTRGWRGVWFSILGEMVYRRLTLIERCVDEPLPRVQTDLPVEFGELHRAEAEDLAQMTPDLETAEVVRRLAERHRCFIARLDGRIVTVRWVARRHARVGYLDCELELADDTAFVYDSYTIPDLRGRNLAGALGAFMVSRLREAGVQTLLAAVLPENGPGFGPPDRLGYRAIGTLATVRLWRWRHSLVLVHGRI
jgi:ribosomal protein S18 acetylase RimI-like enzyme